MSYNTRPPSRQFVTFINKDLELLSYLSNFIRKNHYLNTFYSNVVSKHPWADICQLVWIGCVASIFELGRKHMWVLIINLVASYFLQQVIRARRPVNFDRRFRPIADSLADSHGFPSLESYMCVVLTGHIYFVTKHVFVLVIGIILTIIVGFSRIFALSRFPHQIIGSWLAGSAGLILGEYFCERHGIHKLHAHANGSLLGIFGMAALAVFAMNVESNDSRLLGISKKTFIDVMRRIIGSSKDTGYTADKKFVDDDSDDGRVDRGFVRAPEPELTGLSAAEVERQRMLNATPRTAALKRAIESELARTKKKKEFLKRDSFFFLQQSLERREEERKRLKYSLDSNISQDSDFPLAPTSFISSSRVAGLDSPRSDGGRNRMSERNL